MDHLWPKGNEAPPALTLVVPLPRLPLFTIQYNTRSKAYIPSRLKGTFLLLVSIPGHVFRRTVEPGSNSRRRIAAPFRANPRTCASGVPPATRFPCLIYSNTLVDSSACAARKTGWFGRDVPWHWLRCEAAERASALAAVPCDLLPWHADRRRRTHAYLHTRTTAHTRTMPHTRTTAHTRTTRLPRSRALPLARTASAIKTALW